MNLLYIFHVYIIDNFPQAILQECSNFYCTVSHTMYACMLKLSEEIYRTVAPLEQWQCNYSLVPIPCSVGMTMKTFWRVAWEYEASTGTNSYTHYAKLQKFKKIFSHLGGGGGGRGLITLPLCVF